MQNLQKRGYDWEVNPIELYESTKSNSNGTIIMSNRDVQNLFKFIFSTNNTLNATKDMLRKGYYDSGF